MRFAYADPPYPGMAWRYYSDHPDYAGEVDHRRLVEQLVTGFPDGWALSTSARALPYVLSLLDGVDVRVAAWVRGGRVHQTARAPVSSWEPVVFAGGRQDPSLGCRYDALVRGVGPRTTDPARVVGAKPAEFAWWLFDLLGALPGDDLADLFPGSGGIGRAWAHYVSLDVADDASSSAAADASPEYSLDVSKVVGHLPVTPKLAREIMGWST